MDETIDYRLPGIWDELRQVFATTQPRTTHLSGYYECPPDWRWSSNLRDFDIWLVVKGRGQVHFRQSGVNLPVQAGSLILYRPGDQVMATQAPDNLLTVVASHMDFYDPHTDEVVVMPDRLLPHREIILPDFAGIERLLMRLFRLQDSSRHLAMVESSMILGQILVELYRRDAVNHGAPEATRDPRIERVITRLHQAPHLRPSLDDAAAIAGLTPDYFSRLFTRELHMPFREYALRLRLERARYLLKESDLAVGEVARQLGYTDIYQFSRQFKSCFGCTPTRARQDDSIP